VPGVHALQEGAPSVDMNFPDSHAKHAEMSVELVAGL
jgi:hypothetical protein